MQHLGDAIAVNEKETMECARIKKCEEMGLSIQEIEDRTLQEKSWAFIGYN